MASGEIDLTPGLTLSEVEPVTNAKLNLLARPTLRVKEFAITARELADGSISADKLDEDIAGQLGVPDNSVTTVKIVDGAVTKNKFATEAVIDSMPAGSIIQQWGPATWGVTTGTGATMPTGSLPTWAQGAVFYSLSNVLLHYPTSKLSLRLSTVCAPNTVAAYAVWALFRNQANPCLYTRLGQQGSQADVAVPIDFEFIDQPGTVGPFIYSVRAGPSTGVMGMVHSQALRGDYGTFTIYEIKT